MTWNNRILQWPNTEKDNPQPIFALHEVYYNSKDQVTSYTLEPVCGWFESVDELIKTLEQQLNDAKRFRDDLINPVGLKFAPHDADLPEPPTPDESPGSV